MGSAKSAMYVWVNGKEVGYSQGSKTPAKFNITKYIRKGENSVALQLYRWSDGAYLEGQDYWKISGLERDVYLYSTPNTYIRDFFVHADLDETYHDGLFSLEVDLKSMAGQQNLKYTVKVELLDELNKPPIFVQAQEVLFKNNKAAQLQFSASIHQPRQWTA